MTRSSYAAAIYAAAILTLCLSAPGQAAVPDSLNFQGYLTNAGGSPIDADTDITFRIYNVETSGAPLWSVTQTVPLDQGLFSVTLGGPATPFPVDLFSTPLWVGVEVGSDGEMMPRRALTSAAFAFKADDALSLQGQTPASFDQSGHVDDLSNPHAVDAAQAGAATQDGLDAESSARIAEDNAQAAGLATHVAASGAHHSRYGDAEAIAAMGPAADSNPLHHFRYNDVDAVTAMGPNDNTNPLNHDKYDFAEILGSDGAGSGLDADRVDGLDAESILMLANTNSPVPTEVPLAVLGASYGGLPIPDPFTDPVLIGSSFFVDVYIDVFYRPDLGLTGIPWVPPPDMEVSDVIHSDIGLRYRYAAGGRASPLAILLGDLLDPSTSPDFGVFSLGIFDEAGPGQANVEFRFLARPVSIKRTVVAAGTPEPLIEETVFVRPAPPGYPGFSWEFIADSDWADLSGGSGPYDIYIDSNNQTFAGSVSLPDVNVLPVPGAHQGDEYLSFGELILHDVGLSEFMRLLSPVIQDHVAEIDTRFGIHIDRDGLPVLEAGGCLVSRLSEIKPITTPTGATVRFDEVGILCDEFL